MPKGKEECGGILNESVKSTHNRVRRTDGAPDDAYLTRLGVGRRTLTGKPGEREYFSMKVKHYIFPCHILS